jgi:hypothetical protein
MVMDNSFDVGPEEPMILLKVLEEKSRNGQRHGDIIALVLAAVKRSDDDSGGQGEQNTASGEGLSRGLASFERRGEDGIDDGERNGGQGDIEAD